MTREAKIEAAAAELMRYSDKGGAEDWKDWEPRFAALRAALALPPSPAPSMQEIERLVGELEAGASLFPYCHSKRTSARSVLLAAIRSALGHAEAEGWRAGRDAVVQVMNTRYTDVGRCAVVVMKLIDEARALPAPEVRTQDKEG